MPISDRHYENPGGTTANHRAPRSEIPGHPPYQPCLSSISCLHAQEFDDIFGMPRSGGSVEYLQISRALPGSAVAGDATRAKDGGGDQNNGVALATESRRESHDENPEQEDQPQRVQGEVIVGFAFMAKKMDSMSKVSSSQGKGVDSVMLLDDQTTGCSKSSFALSSELRDLVPHVYFTTIQQMVKFRLLGVGKFYALSATQDMRA